MAELIGDACLVCLLAGGDRAVQPVAVADRAEAGAEPLRPLVATPAAPDRRPELGPYAERFELADEHVAPMRSRGRVVGELVALRRGSSATYTATEKRTLQAIADIVALGLGHRRAPAPPSNAPAPDKLSRREREVLALLALGHTNREIAEQVHLSIRTVEWHRARIQAKLHVTGRAALAQVARAHGLLRDSDRGLNPMAEIPRSLEIGSHLQRMSCYCALIAERLGVDAELIRIASRLHDVGMAAVNSGTLAKAGRPRRMSAESSRPTRGSGTRCSRARAWSCSIRPPRSRSPTTSASTGPGTRAG